MEWSRIQWANRCLYWSTTISGVVTHHGVQMIDLCRSVNMTYYNKALTIIKFQTHSLLSEFQCFDVHIVLRPINIFKMSALFPCELPLLVFMFMEPWLVAFHYLSNSCVFHSECFIPLPLNRWINDSYSLRHLKLIPQLIMQVHRTQEKILKIRLRMDDVVTY